MFELRDYQQDALKALRESDASCKLMVLPTGAGKTVIFAHHIGDVGVERVLVIAHRKEIIEQTVKTLRSIYPDKHVGMMMAGRKDWGADIVVASIQTISRRKTLNQMRKDFDLIIIDEAHHATANTYKRILYRFGLMDAADAGYKNVEGVKPYFQSNRTLLGVTATPRRTDEISLGEVFHEITFSIGIPALIPDYLSDFRAITVSSGVDLSDVREKVKGGELREREVSKAFMESSFIDRLPDIIEEHAAGRKHILLFLPDVASTYASVKKLVKSDIAAAAIMGETPKEDRETYLQGFREGRIRVVANCMVLTEGVDIPHIDCILMARPTKSGPLMQQMLGRGFRKWDGKTNCLLINVAHKRRQRDLMSVVGSGIFGDLSDVHTEHPDLSLMELAELHKERLPILLQLRGVLEQRLAELIEVEEAAAELEEEDDIEELDLELPENDILDEIPDTIQLLMDTEFLRRVCEQTEIGDFWQRLVEEFQKPRYGWHAEPSTQKQREFLIEKGIDWECVDMLNKGEASAIISVLKSIEPATPKQLTFLERLGAKAEAMPKSKADASALINELRKKGEQKKQSRFEEMATMHIPSRRTPRKYR